MTAEKTLFKNHSDAIPLLDDHFQTVSFLAKSLSDENRLRILLCISGGKKSVGGIVEELGLSQPLVLHHIKELKRSLLARIEHSGHAEILLANDNTKENGGTQFNLQTIPETHSKFVGSPLATGFSRAFALIPSDTTCCGYLRQVDTPFIKCLIF